MPNLERAWTGWPVLASIHPKEVGAMPQSDSTPKRSEAAQRFVGLDVHKRYLVATGIDRQGNQVFGPHHVPIPRLEEWIAKHLTPNDAVVLEMTTNTWKVHDLLAPHVHSVTVVHPPHVALIVRAQVKTDKKAALTLAQLHAAGLLPAIWVPPQEVRELRALVAQRQKMVRLGAMTKNRLHALLHSQHIQPPEGTALFDPDTRSWWESLPLTALELYRLQSDLDTLDFAREQIKNLDRCLAETAAKDPRMPLLVQLPGINLINGITILAAIGEITRFPEPKSLVGYAGLGARVHLSGELHVSGRITKAGRRDLRRAMVEAANHAVSCHPHWKAEFERLERRKGRSKAVVAVARKLLVAIWHILTKAEADRYAVPQAVATSLFTLAHRVRVQNLPEGQSALEFTRNQLDRLGIGQEVTHIPWGSKRFKLPHSKLE
jgi:transposase